MKKLSPPEIQDGRKEVLLKNYYFDNEIVERLMHKYVRGACTDIKLRDEIMIHASELINQIIKAHNLGRIYPGKDDSSIMDLFQTAWIQIESALYKYEACPHCAACYNPMRPSDSMLCDEYVFEDYLIKRIKYCKHCKTRLMSNNIYYRGKSKAFNLFSQVARTVILAYIKKENRDRKNSEIFKTHLGNRVIPHNAMLSRFFSEVREMNKSNSEYLAIIKALEELYLEDDKVSEGLISKLVSKTNLPRTTIIDFLALLRSRSSEITDSPINHSNKSMKTLMGGSAIGSDEDL